MKLALVCPTLGQTRRGYERFMADLFGGLAAERGGAVARLHGYWGGGTVALGAAADGAAAGAVHQSVLPHLRRTGWLARLAGPRLRWRRYQAEFASFALALAPRVAGTRFDLLHVIDPPLLAHLLMLRPLLGARWRIVFTHAGPGAVPALPRADHVHVLTPEAEAAARAAGVPPERLTLLPVGVDLARFAPAADGGRERAATRARHGVPAAARVVLCVGSMNRHHKRIDHVVRSVAAARAAGAPLHLWLDGSPHPDGDASLPALARAELGDAVTLTHVASDQVAALYRAADALVSAAVHETFGMAIVEAMACGLPVLAHDNPHFRRLVAGGARLLDMADAHALADALVAAPAPGPATADAAHDATIGPGAAQARAAAERFGWPALMPGYLGLYRSTLAAPAARLVRA